MLILNVFYLYITKITKMYNHLSYFFAKLANYGGSEKETGLKASYKSLAEQADNQ